MSKYELKRNCELSIDIPIFYEDNIELLGDSFASEVELLSDFELKSDLKLKADFELRVTIYKDDKPMMSLFIYDQIKDLSSQQSESYKFSTFSITYSSNSKMLSETEFEKMMNDLNESFKAHLQFGA